MTAMQSMQALSNSSTPFSFEGFNVRVITIGGEPWFIAKDVAKALEYADTDQAVRSHCKAQKTCPVEMTGQVRHVKVIPERDVYRLIMRSQLPAAERFEEWVVGEVLPSVRQHGSYGRATIPQTLPEALRLAADLAEQTNHLKLVITEQAPKVEVYDRISSAAGSMCLTDAAKHLGVRPRAFCAWLRLNRWIFRREGSARWLAYQPRLTSGLLLHRITPIGRDENGDERAATQVRVTAKGLTLLASQLKAEGGV